MRDEINRFQERKVRPFGVNPASPIKHADYALRLKLPFVLLSDPDESITRAYKAVRPWGTGTTRTVYLIGQDGKIAFAQRGAPGSDVILGTVGR